MPYSTLEKMYIHSKKMNQKRVIQACNKKFKEPTKEIRRVAAQPYNRNNNNRETKRVITTSLLWHSFIQEDEAHTCRHKSRKDVAKLACLKITPS